MWDLIGNSGSFGNAGLFEGLDIMSLIGPLGDIAKVIAGICLLIGLVECFAGFKVYKFMMGIYGFFIGAGIGSVIAILCKIPDYAWIVALVMGIIFAILAYKLYLIGVFLMTLSLSALALFLLIKNIYIAVIAAFVIALLAVFFVKPVVIVTTAFSGAELIISSLYIIIGIWNFNPIINIVLKVFVISIGIAFQFLTNRKSNSQKPAKVGAQEYIDESKYPGMQKAYRNYCIKCGCQLYNSPNTCPQCGYSYDN